MVYIWMRSTQMQYLQIIGSHPTSPSYIAPQLAKDFEWSQIPNVCDHHLCTSNVPYFNEINPRRICNVVFSSLLNFYCGSRSCKMPWKKQCCKQVSGCGCRKCLLFLLELPLSSDLAGYSCYPYTWFRIIVTCSWIMSTPGESLKPINSAVGSGVGELCNGRSLKCWSLSSKC